MEKFLLWKVFPTCCLRWIIHFAVLECPPQSASSKSYNARSLSDTVHHLIVAWSRREFVQSSPTEQQVCILTNKVSMFAAKTLLKEITSCLQLMLSLAVQKLHNLYTFECSTFYCDEHIAYVSLMPSSDLIEEILDYFDHFL